MAESAKQTTVKGASGRRTAAAEAGPGARRAAAAAPKKKSAAVGQAAGGEAAALSDTAAPKGTHRAGASGTAGPAQAPPIAAGSAAEGATMAKPGQTTKAGTGGSAKAARSITDTDKIRDALLARRDELRAEYDQTLSEITELQRDRFTDSAGDDQADTGTKTFEREQEISLANGILERITQVERALERLAGGGYGWCERCREPIPVERLAAFPSATLCVSCKQLEERR